MDVNAEVSKLEAAYNLAVQRKDEVREEMARVIREQQVIKWEFEHQKRRNQDYEKQLDKLMMEIAALKSHMPLLGKKHHQSVPLVHIEGSTPTLFKDVCNFTGRSHLPRADCVKANI